MWVSKNRVLDIFLMEKESEKEMASCLRIAIIDFTVAFKALDV